MQAGNLKLSVSEPMVWAACVDRGWKNNSCGIDTVSAQRTFRLTWMTLSNWSSSMLSRKSSCVIPAAFTHTEGGWKYRVCERRHSLGGESRRKGSSPCRTVECRAWNPSVPLKQQMAKSPRPQGTTVCICAWQAFQSWWSALCVC